MAHLSPKRTFDISPAEDDEINKSLIGLPPTNCAVICDGKILRDDQNKIRIFDSYHAAAVEMSKGMYCHVRRYYTKHADPAPVRR